ncbi:uncharacterized protein DUF4251 [Dysgonomonas alginatilytica]|uniref:Uncharacterized protein DUF4251 n=1 Tax=Dysgonomonas alginatilytica TaxID=1605892 RepID=A0A2V3PW81_9BACT|nr:DUF4251 domain-containing protein [Dysgonomonas alginatilytica]PXV69176.1 uncharacterized protein DUF4251 [Dysgonomonas alginatilytica]
MKTILFILTSITLVLTGCSTTKDPVASAVNDAEQQMRYDMAIEALNNREFVLEADRITFKYGQNAFVSPNTNFISMSGDKATIQLAFNSPYAGPNGMGGITVDGSVTNVKMKTDKKGNVTYSMNVMGAGVSAIVFFNITAGTNQCSARVTPNFNSQVITFTGYIYSKEESNVYKGRAL